MALIELKGVSKIYKSGEHELRALDNVDMSIEKGKFVVILGPSGAGIRFIFDGKSDIITVWKRSSASVG